MHDWRQYNRVRYKGKVDVTINVIIANSLEKFRFNAEAADMSRGGVGIIVNTPLEMGYVRFKGQVECKEGTVMWNKRIGNNNRYRVGIRFDHSSSVSGFCQRDIPPSYETC